MTKKQYILIFLSIKCIVYLNSKINCFHSQYFKLIFLIHKNYPNTDFIKILLKKKHKYYFFNIYIYSYFQPNN